MSLGACARRLFELISFLTGGETRAKARALAKGEDPDRDAATLDVLAALKKFPGVRPDPEAFVEALEPLQPRLYSISSSPKAAPGRVSLTVDAVRYVDRQAHSAMASPRPFSRSASRRRTLARVYVQRRTASRCRRIRTTPIIMIGPGTGVAPFRAFLQERAAIGARGRNWLFFGHQRSDCDFFYADELDAMR